MASQYIAKQTGPSASCWAVLGPNGFRFPCLSQRSACDLADRANWNVANGWDWNA